MSIYIGDVTAVELKEAGRRLKTDKAFGTDEIPAEFWEILLEDEEYQVFQWVLEFCNMIWYQK